MKPIILASGSPRRKELMALLDVPYEIKTAPVDETLDEVATPADNVCMLAQKKASAVAETYPDRWVIGSDTVVAHKGTILGKPKDARDAQQTLARLAGNKHEVYTGVSIMCRAQGVTYTFCEVSDVYMKPISPQEIATYVATKEPMDKAGSYAIQGRASVFVERIVGDYFNIVGLPVSKLYDALCELQLISR